MEQKQMNIFDRINLWVKESVMIKLLSIGFLVLILLIPSSWIQSLMEERQERMSSATAEVATKWSGNQTISGPIMVLPYKKYSRYEKDGNFQIVETVEKAYFLPQRLDINSLLEPQILNRGIFDVIVYNASLSMEGVFSTPDLAALDIAPEQVVWKDAYLLMGISDLRGIKEDPVINFGGKKFVAEPSQDASGLFNKSIAAKLNWTDTTALGKNFSLNLQLKGSGQLFYLPTGKISSVSVKGNWSDPSFAGAFLPEDRVVSDSAFEAQWKILHFNRPFPQQWLGNSTSLHEAAFGVDLLLPVDQYQKSIRTAKYSVLIIMLTFISLFLIEIICKVRIHPFQYILIGSALIIYYTLQLSISEHVGFNFGYLIASTATIALIGTYALSFLPTKKIVGLLMALLVLFYTFVYTTTQLQDYALLLGSLGLFLIVGVLMFVSRKIDWYGTGRPAPLAG